MQTDPVPANRLLALVALVLIPLAACSSSTSTSKVREIAMPERPCQTTSASWRGIIPGQSTRSDVTKMLGQPKQKGRKWDRDFFLYPPIITFLDSYGNTIVFRDDGIVDWIDVWVSNSDGKFHTVAEWTQLYGMTLDTVYVNGFRDMLGPDQVYVWSECGIALTAVDEVHVKQSSSEILQLAEPAQMADDQLRVRYPINLGELYGPTPNIRHIVIRKFLFQPTDLDSFRKLYAAYIPYVPDKRFFGSIAP